MKCYDTTQLNESQLQALCSRPAIKFNTVAPIVATILDDVRLNGDKAVRLILLGNSLRTSGNLDNAIKLSSKLRPCYALRLCIHQEANPSKQLLTFFIWVR